MEGAMMRIFLSSTYIDLIDYRQVAVEALERLDQQVRRMEIFGARPVEPSDACLSEIENCDLFVGIYAHRYGYIPDGSTMSITEAELRHARKHKKTIFCYVVEDNHPWPPEMIESEPGRTKLEALKTEIASILVRDTFTTPDNLASKIATSVGCYLAQPSYLRLPPPKMQIVGPGSYFGRFDSFGRDPKDGRFALLLKVRFRNESEQPVLIDHFRVHYLGDWHAPMICSGNFGLRVAEGVLAAGVCLQDNIEKSPSVPAMDVIDRSAFFLLPDPPEPFPGPNELQLTAEAAFTGRSPRQIAFTLTDQGKIRQRAEGDFSGTD
jgi:Domain of unknown function (DUF4062)